MKKKFTKRIFSILLSVVMLVGLLPTAALPVSAVELIGGDTISSVAITVDSPTVGEPLSDCVPVTTLCDILCTWSVRGPRGFTEVPASTIAEEGETYYLTMVLTPKVVLYSFADSVTGTVNGNTVTVERMSSTEVTCTVPITPFRPSGNSATLGDVDFGTKVVGYDSVADHPVITNTGTQLLEFGSAYMKAEMTGDTTAFTYGFNTRMGAINIGNSSDDNLYVRLKAGLAVGTYTATMTLSYDPDGSGTEYGWEVLDTATITAEVTDDTRTVIDTVVANVTNITPIYGKDVQDPTFEVTEGSPAYFGITGAGSWKKWNESTSSWDQKNPGSATFDEGIWCYQVQIRIDGTSGTTHKLADSMSITINGAGSWTYDDATTYVSPTYSYIWVNSPEFTVEAPASDTYTVSGNITSFNSDTDDITLQLITEDYSEVDYEVIVKGNIVTYSIKDVVAGTYTLRVMKLNHVTREYEITVENEDVVQDVKIHLVGDLTGDGRVNAIDVARANAHAKGVSALSGYDFSCVDVNGDGRVNAVDVALINAHSKGVKSLW